MLAVQLARLQFGLTVCFHFIFPSVTIGLSWFVCARCDALSAMGLAEGLSLGPGDALLVKMDTALTEEEACRVRDLLRDALPGRDVVVVGRGVTFVRLAGPRAEATARC